MLNVALLFGGYSSVVKISNQPMHDHACPRFSFQSARSKHNNNYHNNGFSTIKVPAGLFVNQETRLSIAWLLITSMIFRGRLSKTKERKKLRWSCRMNLIEVSQHSQQRMNINEKLNSQRLFACVCTVHRFAVADIRGSALRVKSNIDCFGLDLRVSFSYDLEFATLAKVTSKAVAVQRCLR